MGCRIGKSSKWFTWSWCFQELLIDLLQKILNTLIVFRICSSYSWKYSNCNIFSIDCTNNTNTYNVLCMYIKCTYFLIFLHIMYTSRSNKFKLNYKALNIFFLQERASRTNSFILWRATRAACQRRLSRNKSTSILGICRHRSSAEHQQQEQQQQHQHGQLHRQQRGELGQQFNISSNNNQGTAGQPQQQLLTTTKATTATTTTTTTTTTTATTSTITTTAAATTKTTTITTTIKQQPK